MKKSMILAGIVVLMLFGKSLWAQLADTPEGGGRMELAALTEPVKKYSVYKVPHNMTIAEKKARFRELLLPPVKKVYRELQGIYVLIKTNIESGKRGGIDQLKSVYDVETDEELLLALKPHPVSIVLAQAAMESSWATSRFIREANNAFGIWSFNKYEPRIEANATRGKKRIWLKRYDSLEESVRDNYFLLAKGSAYREFRRLRMKTSDPHELVKKLDNYSEIGARYARDLSSIIRYNKFTQHDLG